MVVYVAGGRLEHTVPHSLRRGQLCPHLHLRLSAPGLHGFDSPRLFLWGEQTRHHPLGSPFSPHSDMRTDSQPRSMVKERLSGHPKAQWAGSWGSGHTSSILSLGARGRTGEGPAGAGA